MVNYNQKLKLWVPVIAVAILSISIISISAEESLIPAWIKNTAGFWVKGDVSDKEFISAIKWMLENNVLKVSSTQSDEYTQNQLDLYKSSYHELKIENEQLKKDVSRLQSDVNALMRADSNYYQEPAQQQKQTQPQVDVSEYCYGSASCFTGYVTEVVDGDTIKVDGKSIRFALVDTPEYGEKGYSEAKKFIEQACPVGAVALVDEDDYQTQGSYGRMIALILCQKSSSSSVINLNEQLLGSSLGKISASFCSQSEFGTHTWAQVYGCSAVSSQYAAPKYEEPKYTPPKSETPKYEPPKSEPEPTQSCDPSYPTVCIPPYPPDLDCGEIPYRNFKVLQPDPHRFDGDKDGIGCES